MIKVNYYSNHVFKKIVWRFARKEMIPQNTFYIFPEIFFTMTFLKWQWIKLLLWNQYY